MGTWKKAILEGDSTLLPTGGTTGQVLAKNSATNYDVAWATASGGGATINNNTNNYLVTATGTANTLNGEANLTFDGSILGVTAKISQSIGNQSVIIGLNAGTYVYSTGYGDVLIGPYTDTTLSYTGNGVAIGASSAIGEAGIAIGSSSKNNGYGVSLGNNSGYNSTGQYMIAIGRDAGRYASANSNVYIGDYSGRTMTTGANNVAVGANALGAATASSASRNVALGTDALIGLTTGADNICIGYRAGQNMTTNGSSVLIGTEAGQSTNLSDRVAIGYQALTGSSGSQTTAVGYRAGRYSTTAARCTYLGHSAGLTFSGSGSGSDNTGVGYNALYAITTGVDNVSIGASALDAVNTGSRNSAIGKDALGALQTGNDNTAVGFSALARNTSGTGSNVAIGSYSLYGAAASQAFGNSAFGYGVFFNIAGGYNNIGIGYQAGYSLTSGAANVFIGYQAGYSETTGSNKLYIANSNTSTPLIYGEFDNGLLRFRNRVEIVGAGATSATTSLLIQDNASASLLTIRNDGGFAFKGGTVGVAQTGYTTPTNLTTDRTFDANATTVDELADVLGTLIEDLKTKGIIAA